MLQAAFTSLLASRNPQLGVKMVPARRPLSATRVAGTPSSAFSGRGLIQVHPLDSLLGKSKWVLIEKQAHAMVKTKDLYSA